MSKTDEVAKTLDGLDREALRQVADGFARLLGVDLSVSAPVPTVAPTGPVAEEKIEFDVVLIELGEKKIDGIKAIREVTGLGLKEAKDMSLSLPKTLREACPKADAELLVSKFRAIGAQVELR